MYFKLLKINQLYSIFQNLNMVNNIKCALRILYCWFQKQYRMIARSRRYHRQWDTRFQTQRGREHLARRLQKAYRTVPGLRFGRDTGRDQTKAGQMYNYISGGMPDCPKPGGAGRGQCGVRKRNFHSRPCKGRGRRGNCTAGESC
jgi:hypothetical protein